jgi:N-acetylglutamate synthase-like GNAT family acetyltransferase
MAGRYPAPATGMIGSGMMDTVEIRPLAPDDAAACDAVLASLPYFFGNPVGIEACAAAVRTQRGWVAEDDRAIIGFVTIEASTSEAAEITWLAVHADHRRGGIGRRLVERVVDEVTREGVEMLCVMTLGPSVPEPGVVDGYEGTRTFYRRVGFVAVKELALSTWSDGYALLLTRCLR